MSTPTKSMIVPFAIERKADGDSDRTFEGLLSVWGLDLGDDVMHKGAFKDTLANWKAHPTDAIPLLNSHRQSDVMAAFGQLIDAKETDDGLWTKWEMIAGADGDAILARLRPGSNGRAPVSKMSIGYEVVQYDFEKSDDARYGTIRNLYKVNLLEGSLVLFPMAPGARIDTSTVKSIEAQVREINRDTLDAHDLKHLRRTAKIIGGLLAAQKVGSATVASSAPNPSDTPAETPAPTPAPEATPDPSTAAPVVEAPPGDASPEKAAPVTLYGYDDALQFRLKNVLRNPINSGVSK